jgi:hypothetical protein
MTGDEKNWSQATITEVIHRLYEVLDHEAVPDDRVPVTKLSGERDRAAQEITDKLGEAIQILDDILPLLTALQHKRN